jgi:hypothetical protein
MEVFVVPFDTLVIVIGYQYIQTIAGRYGYRTIKLLLSPPESTYFRDKSTQGIQLLYPMIIRIRYIQIPGGIHGNSAGISKLTLALPFFTPGRDVYRSGLIHHCLR